jgi:hypothetical protein
MMKKLSGNLLLLFISLSVVFAIGEVASRYVSPVSPGPSIFDLQGNKQQISYVEADSRFRIITPDYDAVTTITEDGYRAPAAIGKPDVIFMGDSFTYGQGVTDDQAFPAIYCKTAGLNCANLAVPGSSTLYEVDHLEAYLKTKNWRPKLVKFFFFTGNDFADNLDAAEKRSKGQDYLPYELNQNQAAAAKKGIVERTIDFGLRHSNLLRIAYFKVLPIIRNDPDEAQASLNKALEITSNELQRLDKLSQQYGFHYQLYVIYPEPEIRHDKYQALGKKLQALTDKPMIMLGELFKENTQDYFFPSDGHYSVAGNKKLAEFLLSESK